MLLSRIFDIVAPESAPQVYLPPLAGVQHPLAAQIVDALRQHGNSPVGLWKLINALADTRQPDSRARRRCWRLRYWGACRELLKAKLLFRHGGEIATSNFATRPRPRSQRRLSPSVRRSVSKNGGSNRLTAMPETAESHPQLPEAEVDVGGLRTLDRQSKTQCATAPELASEAARQLARLPRRRKRIWSGWLNDRVRTYRNMRVELPGGEQVYTFGAKRGLLVYVREPDMCVGDPDEAGRSWGVVLASKVEVVRNPQAVLLGQMKAGTREHRSPSKAATARCNGAKPARRGPRGRPRKFMPP